ncbi:MAG TPA: complex I NDUFA9 subunit family protein [Halobacteriales archaeon]|nr:complex I NDUFA9 subunit family protein [Halobacteriales archaeon]
MDVLVTGGTGFIGSHLCRELSDRGHDVTAFARTPGDADLPAAVETVAGSVTEVDEVTAAAEGADALVNLVSVSPLTRPKGGEEMHDRVHRAGTENCVAAAEAAGVERFVQISGIHADPDGPTPYLRAKGRAEEIVRESDVDHVIFRPTTVFGDGDEIVPFVKTVAPPYLTPLPGGGKTRFQLIWVDDLTPMLADAIEDEKQAGETYEIGGSDVLTLAQIAEMVHRADGRSSTTIPIPMALAGIGMTVGQYVPFFPFGPAQYRSLQMDLVTSDNDLDAFGVDPADLRTFADYLGVS